MYHSQPLEPFFGWVGGRRHGGDRHRTAYIAYHLVDVRQHNKPTKELEGNIPRVAAGVVFWAGRRKATWRRSPLNSLYSISPGDYTSGQQTHEGIRGERTARGCWSGFLGG